MMQLRRDLLSVPGQERRPALPRHLLDLDRAVLSLLHRGVGVVPVVDSAASMSRVYGPVSEGVVMNAPLEGRPCRGTRRRCQRPSPARSLAGLGVRGRYNVKCPSIVICTTAAFGSTSAAGNRGLGRPFGSYHTLRG
jgi:hypothetical protein